MWGDVTLYIVSQNKTKPLKNKINPPHVDINNISIKKMFIFLYFPKQIAWEE